MGKESEKYMYIYIVYICITESLLCPPETNTTILQFKKKKREIKGIESERYKQTDKKKRLWFNVF